MVDRAQVEAEMRAQIAAFAHLPPAQREAMVDEELKQREGIAGRPTQFRIYKRDIGDIESTQFIEPEQKPAETAGFPHRSRVRRIGDLPPDPQDAQPPGPAQRPNAPSTNITTMPVLGEQEARERLASAIYERDQVRERLSFVQQRLSDALDRYDECSFAAASFIGVGSKVVEHDVAAFNAGLDPLSTLPPYLANVRRDQEVARDRLERATALKDRIQAEVTEVQQELDASNEMVRFASHLVVVAIANSYVPELDDLELAANGLRQKIISLQLPGASLNDSLIRRAFAPLRQVRGDDGDKQAWAQLVTRLQDDPSADFI